MSTPPADARRADLDWLRVLAFALLILYHAGMPWSGWGWHIEAEEPLDALRAVMRFMNRWRMPLIFLVSGAAIALALGQRSPLEFVRDRMRRLLLPLLFGMVVLVPPQVWVERRYRGQFAGSFVEFLPRAFDGVYPAGNLSWHHLWFLAYVLVLTLILLPFFVWARSPAGAARLDALADLSARFRLSWMLALPVAATLLWLQPLSSNPNGLIGDWFGLAYYGLFLLFGAVVFRAPRWLDALARDRWFALAVGVATWTALNLIFIRGEVRPRIAADERLWFVLVQAINTVAWLLTILGFARRYLVARPPFLAAATEAVYPFYMLHQTITVLVAWGVLALGIAPAAGYLVTVFATFAGSAALYLLLIRSRRWLRPLFGMKPA